MPRSLVHRIGFLINPIAGMGGRVGLKGTDGVLAEAIALGAQPTSHLRAGEALHRLRSLLEGARRDRAVHWVTCSGSMGARALQEAGFTDIEIAYDAPDPTTGADTRAAAARLVECGVDLILFCGGDGTARDLCAVTGQHTPVLGIPSGVKMYSGVFGTSPVRTAEILFGFLTGDVPLGLGELLDLDEGKYRQGEWAVQSFAAALTPVEPIFTQSAKVLIPEDTESGAKEAIAGTILEDMEAHPNDLFLLGPGSTVQCLAALLKIDKTVLGIDAVVGAGLVGKDLNESGILELIDRYPSCRLIVSPIGAQGFVLGRGNLPLSPHIVRRIGSANLVVIATPAKLAQTPLLRFDTGDAALDGELARDGYIQVVIGYRLRRLVKVAV